MGRCQAGHKAYASAAVSQSGGSAGFAILNSANMPHHLT